MSRATRRNRDIDDRQVEQVTKNWSETTISTAQGLLVPFRMIFSLR